MDKKTEQEDLKLLYEFQLKTFFEAFSTLIKGMTIYLAIVGVSAYGLTTSNSNLQVYGLYLGISASLAAFVGGGFAAIGLYQGLNSIERTLKFNNEILFDKIEMHKYISRGRKTLVIGVICSIVALFAFIITMAVILFNLS